MRSATDARRRWFGALFLILAAGLLIWGQTILKPYLKSIVYVAYWLTCFLFTIVAMLTALMDIRSMRRQTRQQQRELLEKALHDISTQAEIEPHTDASPSARAKSKPRAE